MNIMPWWGVQPRNTPTSFYIDDLNSNQTDQAKYSSAVASERRRRPISIPAHRRDRRSGHLAGLVEPSSHEDAFRKAGNVVLSLHRPDGTKYGAGGHTEAHQRHIAGRLRESKITVLVDTHAERLKYWLTEARRICPAGAVVEFLDNSGVSRVTAGGLQ